MVQHESPLSWYQQQLAEANTTLQQLLRKKRNLGWIRLACLLVPVALLYIFLPHQVSAAVISSIAGIAFFLYVITIDANNSSSIEYEQRRVNILQTEIAVLHNEYAGLDDGKRFEPAVHGYAADIDIFGSHSLYQYIGRCESEQGKQLLASHFLQPLPAEKIVNNQQAAAELAPQALWRQTLQNYGQSAQITQQTEKRVLDWLAAPETVFKGSSWNYIVKFYPVIPFGLVLLNILDIISSPILTGLLFLLFVLASSATKNINAIYFYVSRIVPQIAALQLQLLHIEKQQWQSSALRDIQSLGKQNNTTASGELLELTRILNRFDFRLNVFAMFFLNTFLLWDIRQTHALLQWKRKNKSGVADWFAAIAQMEVLNTLATLRFNQPSWVIPVLSGEHFTLEAENAGHPLIPAEKRVNNSCTIRGTGQVMLITGSNMAGKSTFLRSLGVNTILAMMGAPVCATRFTISPVHLISSMRIADNLAENTSTFYAELKKLQQIIEQVNLHHKVFILLDEILRGTNSLDRHTGSKALIQQLIKEEAIAVVATHDIELSNLHDQYPSALHNYHFDVQVAGEEDLYFDYKLKRGVCQSMNASILMKKIGIKISTT